MYISVTSSLVTPNSSKTAVVKQSLDCSKLKWHFTTNFGRVFEIYIFTKKLCGRPDLWMNLKFLYYFESHDFLFTDNKMMQWRWFSFLIFHLNKIFLLHPNFTLSWISILLLKIVVIFTRGDIHLASLVKLLKDMVPHQCSQRQWELPRGKDFLD